MISANPARRRAEEFAAVVDGRPGAQDSRFSDLLELVGELREIPAATPRSTYVSDLRSQLMAAADEVLVSVDGRLTLKAPTHSRSRRRIAFAAGTLALVGATSSVAMAAQTALPGDALYPIKRVLESAETSLQADDTARAETILDNASGRLEEAQALALRDSAEAQAAMPDTLDDFTTQANQAADLLLDEYAETGDRDNITELRSFTGDSLDLLATLESIIPADLLDHLTAAVDALLAIDARALDACPECGGLLDIPTALVSAGSVSGAQLPPIAPPYTLEAAGEQSVPALDPVSQLIAQLPLVDGVLPPASGGTGGGTTGEGGETGGEEPALVPENPIGAVTDPLVGEEGLLTQGPLGDLLNPLLEPLIGEGGLLG